MLIAWPSWHPDQELKAEHLIALEDYVLTRVALLDEGAYGVESFDDWSRSIKLEETTVGLTIKVFGPLRGITPAGQHVWLWSDSEWLETIVETTGDSGSVEFDLWIVVNSRTSGSTKLPLRAAAVQNPKQADPIFSVDTPGELYVGRYRMNTGDANPEIVHRPMPRRLCGFGTVGDPA